MLNSGLYVHLFGTARVSYKNQAVEEFPTEKVKFLFYYLMLFNRSAHPRALLQGLFWGDRPEERAQQSLRTELWRLRRWFKSLGPAATPQLVIQDSEIRFQLDAHSWLDTDEFEKQIKQANRIRTASPEQAALALRRAVDLYDGELLRGCYYDWCLVERERLRQLFLEALIRLMVHHGERQEYEDAVRYGQRILQEEPLREDIHRELIKLYALNQQTPQAIAQYQACENVLQSELHIEPDVETRELFQRLVTGAFDAPRRSPFLPEPAQPGGERQIALLTARVSTALEQLEATRRELADALQALEQLKKEGERKKRTPRSL